MSKNKKKWKSFFKISAISLCVFAGAKALENQSVILVPSREILKDAEIKLQTVEEETGITTNDNQNMIILYYAMQNEKLNPNEKELIYQLSDLLKENPYIDVTLSSRSISKLDIVYKDKPNNYKDTTVGLYSSMNNEISIFVPKEELNQELLFHELVHCIFNNVRTYRLPDYFVEGTTELLTNEYFSKTPFLEETTYPFEVTMVKILCEMADPDTVLKAYSEGGMSELILELGSTLGEEESIQFLSKTKEMFNQFEEDRTIKKEDLEWILNVLDYYFTEKFKENENQQMMERYIYYEGILRCMNQKNPYEEYLKYINENGIIMKPYFSEKLKSKYPKSTRITKDGGKYTGVSYQYVYRK